MSLFDKKDEGPGASFNAIDAYDVTVDDLDSNTWNFSDVLKIPEPEGGFLRITDSDGEVSVFNWANIVRLAYNKS